MVPLPIRLPRAARPIALIAVAALAMAACGGGSASATPSAGAIGTPVTATAAATTQASASPVSTSAAATTSAPAPSSSSSEPPAVSVGTLPTFDLHGLTDHLAGVDSFRTSFVVDGVEQYSSTVTTSPEVRRQVTFLDGGQTTTIVVIGDKSWVRSADQTAFQEVPNELSSAMLGAFDPTAILTAFMQVDWTGHATALGAEQKNGIAAHHYRLDPTSAVALGAVPAGAAIDVWIADAGFLAAWESTGLTGKQDIDIEVTHIDDPANVVAPPS